MRAGWLLGCWLVGGSGVYIMVCAALAVRLLVGAALVGTHRVGAAAAALLDVEVTTPPSVLRATLLLAASVH